MSSLTTRGRQVRTRLYDPAMVAQLAVAALAVGAFWFTQGILALPDKVGVTVTNPTEYDIDVDVRAPDTATRAVFGRVEGGAARTQSHLLDPGESWVFVFRHDGVEVGELRLSEAELEDLGHTVEVPPEVTAEARAAGLTPTPD